MSQLYYTPPDNVCFIELKNACLEIWKGYLDIDPYSAGYVAEKTSKVRGVQNVSDNFMFLVAMFDQNNQRKLAAMLSEETRNAVRDRLIDGGQPDWANPFL